MDINVHGAPNFRAPRPTVLSSSPSLSTPSSSAPHLASASTSSSPPPIVTLPTNITSASSTNESASPNLNVYGCAQPRTQGLRAILSVLRCRPTVPTAEASGERGHVVWFCTREEPIGEQLVLLPNFATTEIFIVYISGRPFVLRDVSEPRETLALSDRAENLEGIESRLKQDILAEAGRFGGLVLTHNEIG